MVPGNADTAGLRSCTPGQSGEGKPGTFLNFRVSWGEECHAVKESLEQSWLAAVLLLTVLHSGLCN